MDFLDKLTDLLPIIIVLLVIYYIIYKCAEVYKNTISNIDKFGGKDDATEKKFLTTKQSIFNFYIIVGISFTVLSAFLKLISIEVFLHFLLLN